MIAAISLFIVVFLSMLTTRIATIALSHTGLSRESAQFQARSALTGAGYTTNESEKIVGHPVRRRIIFTLMLIGNAGIVTAMSSLILTFVIPETKFSLFAGIIIIVIGVSAIWSAAQSKIVDRFLSKIIDRALNRYTSIDVRDYSSLLHLTGDYQVTELHVDQQDWLASNSLKELELHNEGVIILGIQRAKGNYIGAPTGDTKIMPKDTLTIYGKSTSVKSLDKRKKGASGDREHKAAVREHQNVEQAERKEDQTDKTVD